MHGVETCKKLLCSSRQVCWSQQYGEVQAICDRPKAAEQLGSIWSCPELAAGILAWVPSSEDGQIWRRDILYPCSPSEGICPFCSASTSYPRLQESPGYPHGFGPSPHPSHFFTYSLRLHPICDHISGKLSGRDTEAMGRKQCTFWLMSVPQYARQSLRFPFSLA